ncbi:hypothetical protein, partial [Pseudomonas sp. UBA6323]|uniref:hypothetical protein n=1 Tax=Pseudomonas sp. UBA6323 TaxID=1947329 RepID=UPI0025CD6874
LIAELIALPLCHGRPLYSLDHLFFGSSNTPGTTRLGWMTLFHPLLLWLFGLLAIESLAAEAPPTVRWILPVGGAFGSGILLRSTSCIHAVVAATGSGQSAPGFHPGYEKLFSPAVTPASLPRPLLRGRQSGPAFETDGEMP